MTRGPWATSLTRETFSSNKITSIAMKKMQVGKKSSYTPPPDKDVIFCFNKL